MNLLKYTLLRSCIILGAICIVSASFANADPPIKSVLLGNAAQIEKNKYCVIVDSGFYMGVGISSYDTATCKYANIVTLTLDEQSTKFIPSNFTVTVPLHIVYTSKYKDGEGQYRNVPVDTSLTIHYNKDSGYFVTRNYIVDSNYWKVTVTVRDSLIKNVDWDVSQVLRIENELRVTRDYVFTCTTAVTGLTANYKKINNVDQLDELLVSWADPGRIGQTGYDVEWAWIDESAVESYKRGGTYTDKPFFENNASRVTIGLNMPSPMYSIPLLYDGVGRLFYRVRPVQDKTDGSRLEGAWTTVVLSNNTLTNFFAFIGHENNLNWQVTTSYAEEGKRKTVIQYFDGSLRSRQTVTKDNTEGVGTTVVAETMYDFQGRPAIQVLPAPTLNTMISFSKNFNTGLVGNYTKNLYDGLNPATEVACLKGAAAMNTNTGASNYYSTANPLKESGMHQYIPDAKEYPFTETRYTPDATGRIAAQSGVGPDHQLGSNHETRYFYGNADQEDLDPLFGTDVGYESHYFKNMVRDANGQYSVSYVDMHGRTVATALAGLNPPNLKPLSSMIPRALVTKNLLDKETNILKGRSTESVKTLLVPSADSFQFQYSLDPQSLSLLDKNNVPVCYSCMYDLEIQISNDCGNCDLPGKQIIYIRRNNVSLQGLNSDNCTNNKGLAIDSTIYLEEGSYTVRKTLTLSRQAQDIYRDSLFTRRNTIKTFQSFYDEIYTGMSSVQSNCKLRCDVCKTRLGSEQEFQDKFLLEAQITSPSPEQLLQIQQTWNNANAACQAICDSSTSRLFGVREAMLQDMMPDLGQYAESSKSTKQYNIFNEAQQQVANWRRPRNTITDNIDCYTDLLGQCVDVHTVSRNEVDSFISVFQETWAKNLLFYHPEYYRLKLAEDPSYLKNSFTFDHELQGINNWNDAMTYLGAPGNYDILQKDPFFSNTNIASASEINAMSSKIGNISNGFSMWKVAYAVVKCNNVSAALQGTCIKDAPTTITGINSASDLCAADKDLIWSLFRQMYLAEKEKIVYAWTTAKIFSIYNVVAPTSADLGQMGYTPRFVDPATLAAYPGGGLLSTVLTTPPNITTITNQTNTALTDHYRENCNAMAENWLNKLQVFKICKPSISDADLDVLIVKLKGICEKGSDATHPFGSSSVNPSLTNYPVGEPKSFEEAIAWFMSAHSIAVSTTCHPYILSDMDPQLYQVQQPFSNPQILTKPDSCQCAQISKLKGSYVQSGVSGTFSNYLAQYHGTIISQATLDTLQNLCNGSYVCAVLPAPIVLPPVLQCGATLQTCIDCQTFATYRDSFKIRFGTVWPVANHTDTLLLPIDSAFTAFVNYKTGFNKTAFEYLSFADTCSGFSAGNDCYRLDSIAHAFTNTYNRNRPAIGGPGGCDTSHWVSNYGEGTLQVVPLSEVMINGEFVPKLKSSNNLPSSLDYGDNVCLDSIMTIEARVKIPRTGPGYNPYGSNIYCFELATYFTTTSSAVGRADFAFVVNNGNTDLVYQRDPSGVQIMQLPYIFEDYRIFKVVVSQSQFKLYIDGVHIADLPHLPYQRFSGFYYAGYSQSFRVDWIKMYDKYDQVIMQEDFDHSCDRMAYITRDPCSSPDCQVAFANYYNQVSGTSYSYNQINNISQQQCDKQLAVCDTAVLNVCDQLNRTIQKFTHMYNRNQPAIGGPGRCDTAHWVSNYGQGTLQVVPYSELMVNGEFAPKFTDSIGLPPSSLDYNDDVCLDSSMTIEARIKIPRTGPGYNPYGSNNFCFELATYFTTTYSTVGKADFAFVVNNGNTDLVYQRDPSGVQSTQIPSHFDDYRTFKLIVSQSQFKVYIDGVHIADFPHQPYQRFSGLYYAGYSKSFRVDWIKMYDKYDQVIMQEDFDHNCSSMAYITRDPCISTNCQEAFVTYYNQQNNTNYSYDQINTLSVNNCGKPLAICNLPTLPRTGPKLCGLNTPKFPTTSVPEDTCGADVKDMVFDKATAYYEFYKDSLQNVFDTAYVNRCLKVSEIEKFKVTHKVYEYHYTLYYYDQAGNLVQTVPPEGVRANYDPTWLQEVAAARADESSSPKRPPHQLVTQYRYNTLNQVVEQATPDAGKSNFWYDRLGRLVVSQNAKQAIEGAGKYSYTLYDPIGRITEVGQKPKPASPLGPMNQDLSRNKENLDAWLNAGGDKEEITKTIYDFRYEPFATSLGAKYIVQRNLRNRVSYVQLFDTQADMNIPAGHKAATYYTYDIHGNVDVLLQDINQSVMKSDIGANRFKQIQYTYDLISGKVNAVAYQRGWKDQFFHEYKYDAENRIIEAWTSADEIYWERDAQYEYYKHGPLARTVLGQLQVQGVDYAYTLQGWLKGVNGTASPTIPEGPVEGVQDMGKDGNNTNYVAKDVFGFSLNYYKYTDNSSHIREDYTAIHDLAGNNRVRPFAEMPVLHTAGMPNAGNGGPLYNGNINAMMVNLPKVGAPILYSYSYDQLNRIVAMDAYNGFIPSSNTWNVISTQDYRERVSYDGNGNILTYLRNANTSGNKPLEMDNLTYQYEKNGAGQITSNKLRYVHDQVDAGNYATDIDNETTLTYAEVLAEKSGKASTDNYQYDPIGNLVKDVGNKITEIKWTVYGKIKKITKENGTIINYTYDAAGNRITKTVTTTSTGSVGATTKVTVYVRDAQGNVMSIYTKHNGNNLKQSEVDIYGSSRLGIWKPDRDVQLLTAANTSLTSFIRGAKQYELSNHLGNVMVTLTDSRVAIPIAGTTTIHHYEAMIASANDYYPFGMQLPGRNQSDGTAGSPGNPTGRIRIEAENYSGQEGVETENCGDLGGTLDVGYIDEGNFISYNVAAPVSGVYTLNFRLANGGSTSSFQVKDSVSGAVLGTVSVPNTGGWQNYVTLSATATLPAGQQTLQLLCTSNNWNLNWLELLPPGTGSGGYNGNGAYHIEAEDFISQNGTLLENCQDGGGTYNVGSIDNGDWMDYRVNMPVGGTYQLRVRAATGNGGTVQLRTAAGTVLATLPISNTNGYQTFQTFTANVTLPAGVQTLRLAVTSGYLSVNWLELAAPPGAPPLDNYALVVNSNNNYAGGLYYDVENTFTVEFLVKPSGTHEVDVESTTGFGGTSGQKYVLFPVMGGESYDSRSGMGVSVGTNGVSVYEHAAAYMPALLVWESPTPLTEWTHVAVVYHNGKPSLYINGVWKKDGLQSPKSHVHPGTALPGGYYGNQANGQVDEVRIWSVARTQQQLAANRDGELTGEQTGLVGYWPMNEGTGAVLHDVSGWGRDIDLTHAGYGSASWTNGRYSINTTTGSYRYAFNGQEHSTEIGDDSYTAEFWEYDSRIGRRWNVDPVFKEYESPYACLGNNPISNIDPNGADSVKSLSNAQLLDAVKIASNEVKTVIKDKSKYYSEVVKNRLLEAADQYWAVHQDEMNLGQFAEFKESVDQYYNGLATVAWWSGSSAFEKLDRSVINNSHISNSTAVKLTAAYINDKDAGMQGIMGQAVNAALFVSSAALFPNVGPGPKGTRINSNTQQKIVNSVDVKALNKAANLTSIIKQSGMTNAEAGSFFGWKSTYNTKTVNDFTRSTLENNGWNKQLIEKAADAYKMIGRNPGNPSAIPRATQLRSLLKLFE